MKHTRTVEPGKQLLRRSAPILIEHAIRNIVQIVRSRIAEDQALEHRRNKQTVAAARILENRQQLLAGERQYSMKRFEHFSGQALSRSAVGERPQQRRHSSQNRDVGQNHRPDIAG